MPQSVKLGDRYWLMMRTVELPAEKERLAEGMIHQMDRAFKRGDEDEVFEWAKTLVQLTCMDEIEPDSIEVLTLEELGELVNAVSSEPYTFPTN